MNEEWAVEELEGFISLIQKETRVIKHEFGAVVDPRPRYVGTAEEITSKKVVVEKIFDLVLPEWRNGGQVLSGKDRYGRHRRLAMEAKALIEQGEEIEQNLGETAPEISASRLHPWIWGGAESLWASGHHREAVESAIKRLNAETQKKVDSRLSETDLFKNAFSVNQPKKGEARLRRMKDDGSKTFQSMQRGTFTFAEGIFAGIRNPLGHEDELDLSKQEALEYLAALSVLARWVDSSELQQVE